MKEVIAANANETLPQLAEKILAAARGFGSQLDDQIGGGSPRIYAGGGAL
jgi:hypothetical protein